MWNDLTLMVNNVIYNSYDWLKSVGNAKNRSLSHGFCWLSSLAGEFIVPKFSERLCLHVNNE